jgi:carbon storage regulator CsrA
MLVLSRKINESIVIDGQIKIEVLKVKGNTIRLGITAPNEVRVLRGELAPFGKQPEMVVEATERGQTRQAPLDRFRIAHAS